MEKRTRGVSHGGVSANGSSSHLPGDRFPKRELTEIWADIDTLEEEVGMPANADDWLALRVVGGARSWSLPNFPKLKCFTNEV